TGVINYFYPGSNWGNSQYGTQTPSATSYSTRPGQMYNLEYYLGANWKTVSLKQFFALTDYFNVQGFNGSSTAGSGYTDLRATYDLSDLHPWLGGVSLLGHAGYLYISNFSQGNYADWELGFTKDFGQGWNAKVSYIQADTSNSQCGKNAGLYCYNKPGTSTYENGGHGTAMVTVGRTF
ncbi:MAG: TorF family putative porin, partial [Fluviibacter sp.]